jgi:hypothetical protein
MRAPDGGVEKHCGRKALSTCTVTVGRCTPQYFVDGRPWTPTPRGKGALAEIEEGFGIANLKGVEIYRPELTPIGFITNDNAQCSAAINFWTDK